MVSKLEIAVIKGDGIGVDVTQATIAVMEEAAKSVGGFELSYNPIAAGAGYYSETGVDIEPGGEDACGKADAILLGAIGLPSIRYENGTEISPHLRLRDKFQLYAGIRPIKAYPNSVQKLADPRAVDIDMIILRESTEGLFYSAAVHNRSHIIEDLEVSDTLKITRATTEKLHNFAFKLAEKRKQRGKKGQVTCVDKANVFNSMAFFRKIYDEIAPKYPEIQTGYNYVDAQALDLIRRPWDFDVLVMENMFGDILSDLAGGLVGGMGMASCAEIGDEIGLFQPAHGSAPDIMGKDAANPLAAILSGALMLDYLGEKTGIQALSNAAEKIDSAVATGFEENQIHPIEFGGNMGTKAVTNTVIDIVHR
ncbi:MAG: isocitrate/isopropylmalate dehydrogenase family protein [Rhizobiaceae bacterium]|nr:isocitrate/isopropylmalate dehydrogenase family protein [Rhizobiaceae bacterium]